MVQQNTSRLPEPTSRGTSNILLVEDDVSLRRSLQEFLKDAGHQPTAVGTMREAAVAVRALRPALCLLDLNLPDGSGLDLLKQIVAEHLPVRVIVMTAFPLQHLQPNYPATTLAGWLTKPVPPGALLEAVDRALDPQTGSPRSHGGTE